jgi:hypothetical protein
VFGQRHQETFPAGVENSMSTIATFTRSCTRRFSEADICWRVTGDLLRVAFDERVTTTRTATAQGMPTR